jgi:N-acyl homoserine lactone hydrolase
LLCGQVGVNPAVPNRGVSKNPLAFTGLFQSAKKRIFLPVKAFYVHHPKGDFVIDAGWDEAVRSHPIRTISYPLWFTSKPLLPEGESVRERLASFGIRPQDLSFVLMTHMDIDHDSGLVLLKDAPRVYVAPEEIQALHSADPRYLKKAYKNIPLTSIPWQKDPTAPYQKSWDVFGDGQVLVFYLPGHTAGSVVMKISGKEGFLLIVGDSGYNKDSWEKGYLPGPVFDKKEMARSLLWLREQEQNPQCLALLAAHDGGEKRLLFELH